MTTKGLTITKAVVVISRHGTDKVILTTTLPSPFPPEVDAMPLQLHFEVQRDYGVAYCEEHFEVKPEVIKLPGA